MLSKEDRDRIEKRLLQERERAVELLEQFDEKPQDMHERSGEMSLYRFHPADLGTEMMEKEKDFLLASNEGRRLYDIDEALRRLYRTPDEFGVCSDCGETISVERLEIVPQAANCIACQERAEARRETEGAEGAEV